ncbi:MAG: hypothetical protein ACM3U2_01760, partial [Deltaproteobacteria bacterium]
MPPINHEESPTRPEPGRAPDVPDVDHYPTVISNTGETEANQAAAPAADSDEITFWIGRRLARYEVTRL